MNTQTLDGEVINSRLEDARTYEGVRTRRVFAFIVDYVIVALLCVPFCHHHLPARRSDTGARLDVCSARCFRLWPCSMSGSPSAAGARQPWA